MPDVAKPLVLLVGSEPFTAMLQLGIQEAGFSLITTSDGENCLALVKMRRPRIVALEADETARGARELLQKMRADPDLKDTPVALLVSDLEAPNVAASIESDGIECLDKRSLPVNLIEALKKRFQTQIPSGDRLVFGDLMIELKRYRAYRGGRRLKLSPRQFQLLEYFLRNPGEVFSREQIVSRVWGNKINIVTRAVDVHVGHLRRELVAGGEKNCIRSVRSAGYALDFDDD